MTIRKLGFRAALAVCLGLFLGRPELAALYQKRTPIERAEQKQQGETARLIAQNELYRQAKQRGYRAVSHVTAKVLGEDDGTFEIAGEFAFRDPAGVPRRSVFQARVGVQTNTGQVWSFHLGSPLPK